MPEFAPNPRTAPTMVSGARTTDTTLTQRIKPDIQDELVLYQSSAYPLVTLLSGKGFRQKRTATQYQFDWIEKDLRPRTVTVNTAYLAGATSIVLQSGHGDRVAKWDLILNTRTRELSRVTSVSTDTLTVVPTYGGGTAAAGAIGDTLVIIGSAYEENADLGTLKTVKESREFNYTQTFRTPYGWSGRQMNTDMFGGKDPMTERKWNAIEHEISMEKAFFFGKRHSVTGPDGKLVTTTGGLEFFIQSNVWDVTGIQISERAFVEFLESAMKEGKGGHNNGGNTKYLFHSARWGTEIEFWAKDRLRLIQNENITKLGLKLREYESTHGTVVLVHAPVLDGDHPDTACLVDLNHARYVYHQGRDTQLRKDVGGNGVDGETEELLTDCGFQLELEAAHAWLKNLSA